ncbi:MAG: FAD-binding oxidoreductase [Actinomycetia bacterium]|nr:FAD-binding oxidoreductase [Actinomycetes bacterium]
MSVLVRLRDAVGAAHVLSDADVTRPYGTDWTGRWSVVPLAVVRPANTAEVIAVMQVCATEGLSVVPQGGNTGLVGGSVPGQADAVVLSLRRLTAHSTIDTASQQVTVGAGTTIAQVHAIAAASGLTYGVDLASRDSATIGGTVATNAGGVRVVRFGDTRAQVVGVEAVFADGTLMDRTGALPKDSAGYDISRLLVGSEGTLAVVTTVRLQLRDQLPADRVTAMVGVASLGEAVELLHRVARSRDELFAAEYIDDHGMQLVCQVSGLPHPLSARWPYYLLTETTRTPLLAASCDAAVDRRLWAYRERQSEAAATLGPGHSLDIALAPSNLDDFLARLPDMVRPHRVFTFGHLAEGNVHIQVNGPEPDDLGPADAVLAEVAALGGSVSSEHGVGRAKPRYLPLTRDAAEISAMRAIKNAMDPQGLLNPGVLFTREPPSNATMSAP